MGEATVLPDMMEIDNNHIKNTMRSAALGRKNWRFIGDGKAGHHTLPYV